MKKLLSLIYFLIPLAGYSIHIHIKVSPELVKDVNGDLSQIYDYHVKATAKKTDKLTTITLEFRELDKKGLEDELPILSQDTFGQLSLKRKGVIVAEMDLVGKINESTRTFEFTVANDLLQESLFTLRSYPQTKMAKINWLKERAIELEGKESIFGPTHFMALHGANCDIPLHLTLKKELWKGPKKKSTKQNKDAHEAADAGHGK